MAPSRVGPFAIEDSLRRDGRGATFRAIHVDKRKVLALKLFSAPLAGQNTDATDQFYAETARLKAIDHIHIARCYGGGFDQNTGYIAFELIEGESLAELIERRGRLSWEMALEFSKQLVSALEYLHSQRLYHLDLRPEKMVIDNLDQVQLLDCRVDRPSNPFQAEQPLTNRLQYQAPEQLAGERQTHKTDLYQVGCLLYHMLTGAAPYSSCNTVAERLAMQQAGPPPRVSEIIFDCPVWLETIIGQLLAFDADDRPFGASATMLAFNEATRKMASGAGVAEHAAGGFSSLAKPEDADEAKRLLGKVDNTASHSMEPSGPPIWERSWFLFACLSVCLLLICGYIAWIAWPLSNGTMLARADQLMASGDATDWVRAKQDYLEPLLERNPQGEVAERAREHLKTISIYTAERRRVNNRKFNKPPKTEGERLINQALDLAEFGDVSAAREKLNSMATLLQGDEKEEPYVLLAEKKLAELEGESTASTDRAKLVQAKLDEAEALHQQGKTSASRKIWKSVVELYKNDETLKSLAEKARQRLEASS